MFGVSRKRHINARLRGSLQTLKRIASPRHSRSNPLLSWMERRERNGLSSSLVILRLESNVLLRSLFTLLPYRKINEYTLGDEDEKDEKKGEDDGDSDNAEGSGGGCCKCCVVS